MALSVVNFRMHHGNTHEQVTFSGNWIKLLDLKKEILDKKKISGSLDFDLKIVDEKTSKEYKEDDETVPKNSTVVVKRIPSKNSLIARLNNRNTRSGGGGG
jgi:protein MPE1